MISSTISLTEFCLQVPNTPGILRRHDGMTQAFMYNIVSCDSETGSEMISRGLSAPLFLQDLRQN
nr:hypothetical protein Itr_chr03CG08470 [Ipomoea trifida]GMD08119.1 hypothetical protein Iba_chr06cCG13680 [Ipomoea batatas]